VVEKGLHLPEAARALRLDEKSWPAPPPPLPTVTLAEIYAAQGHFERAIATLDEVLGREPEHREARSLRERFVEQLQRARARAGRVEPPPPPPPKPAKPAKKAPSTPPAADPADAEPAVAEAAAPTSDEVASTQPAGHAAQQEAAPDAEPERREAAAEQEAAERADDETSPAIVQAAEGEQAEEAARAEPEEAAPPTDRTPSSVNVAEEPPLPQRYEVDEIVAVAVDPRTIYLYWEVRATTLAHARAVRPDGALCVRIASVTASWDGPQMDTRDMPVDALYGDRFVREIQPGSNVRVSLGWKSSAGFEPLAVAVEVTAPRAVPVGTVADEVGRWEEQAPVAPFHDWRPDALPHEPPSPAARAFEPFVPHAHVAAAPAASFSPSLYAGPVDTGVADWNAPPAAEGAAAIPTRIEVERREEAIVEPGWFVRGGASELSRGGPGRVLVRTVEIRRLIPGRPGAPRLGGASELARGGASELTR
jgi:hypothetical protein